MRKLVVDVHPFTFKQTIYVFDEGVLTTQISSTLADLPHRIVSTAAADNTTEVDIRGAVDFTMKIKEQIQKEEVSKYGKKTLNIELISGK